MTDMAAEVVGEDGAADTAATGAGPPAKRMTVRGAVFLGVGALRNDPGTFVAIAVMLALAVILDLAWKRARDRPAGETA